MCVLRIITKASFPDDLHGNKSSSLIYFILSGVIIVRADLLSYTSCCIACLSFRNDVHQIICECSYYLTSKLPFTLYYVEKAQVSPSNSRIIAKPTTLICSARSKLRWLNKQTSRSLSWDPMRLRYCQHFGSLYSKLSYSPRL